MTIEVTCGCGRAMSVPARYAGRKGRCKGCGSVLQIPDAGSEPEAPGPSITLDPGDQDGYPVTVDDDDAAAVLAVDATVADEITAPDAPKPLPPPVVGVLNPAVRSPAVPPEPWFYSFLDGFAMFVMVAGIMACSLGALLGAATAFNSSGGQTGDAQVFTGMYVFAVSCVSVFPVLLSSAPVMLAVDVARNVRATRYKPTP